MSYFIYKIVCEDLTDFVYVGSTKAYRNRKSQHKSRVNTRDTILYKTIRDNGGWENWRMVCIEECDDTIDSKRKAEAREEEWRQKLNANLNMRKCFLTEEQIQERDRLHKAKVYQENKEYFISRGLKENMSEERYEKKREYAKKYYQKNKIKNKNI